MKLREILSDIDALEEELLAFERRHGQKTVESVMATGHHLLAPVKAHQPILFEHLTETHPAQPKKTGCFARKPPITYPPRPSRDSSVEQPWDFLCTYNNGTADGNPPFFRHFTLYE